MARVPLVTAALLALAACAPKPETPEQAQARLKAESDSAKAAIEAADARIEAHTAAGSVDSTALGYTEDAVLYMSGSPAVVGRAAIRSAYQQMFGMGSWRITPSDTKVEASGPLAVETGRYVISFTPGPHAPAGMAAMYPDSGNFLATWRKVDGRWLITRDMTVSTRAPAPARKR